MASIDLTDAFTYEVAKNNQYNWIYSNRFSHMNLTFTKTNDIFENMALNMVLKH